MKNIILVFIFCSIALTVKSTDIEIIPTKSDKPGGYNVSCNGSTDGWIHISVTGGIAPYYFNWSNGAYTKNIQNIGAGSYTITVTDIAGTTATSTIEMYSPGIIQENLNPVVLEGGYHIRDHGGNSGIINTDISGTVGDITYLWSNGSTENYIDHLTAGTYTLTVTDINGCSASASTTLIQPTQLHVSSITSPQYNGYNISCFGGNNGAINLNVAGGTPPYDFNWNFGSGEQNPTDLEAGHYSVIVNDANRSYVTAQIDLTQPPDFKITAIIPSVYTVNGLTKNTSCNSCSNGSLTVQTTGGVNPVGFQWTGGPAIAQYSGLVAGNYTVTVTDGNQCTASGNSNIVAPERDDWSMTGNSGSNPSTQFMGTTDNKDFVFKTNNQERLRLKSSGQITIPGLAGTGPRVMMLNTNGEVEVAPIGPINIGSACNNYTITFPWKDNGVTGPYGGNDVVNCDSRFGFGIINPQERIHINGNIRLGGVSNNYLNIGFNGDAKINSFGNDLLINNETSQNVKINTGTNQGAFYTGGNTYLATLSGKVGIGTNQPNKPLSVNGDVQFLNNDNNNSLQILYGNQIPTRRGIVIDDEANSGEFNFFIHSWQTNSSFNFITNDQSNSILKNLFRIQSNGNIGIGVDDPTKLANSDFKLNVNGGIRASMITVYEINNWYDFVLAKGHKIMPLSDLQNYINQHNHLPDMPSSEEVCSDGINIAEIQGKLLAKIEELTLYILEIKNDNEQLKLQIDNLKKN